MSIIPILTVDVSVWKFLSRDADGTLVLWKEEPVFKGKRFEWRGLNTTLKVVHMVIPSGMELAESLSLKPKRCIPLS